jgi:TonB family protein
MKSYAIPQSMIRRRAILLAVLCSGPAPKLLKAQSSSSTTSKSSAKSPAAPFQANAVSAGVGVVPGALVCQDLATVGLVVSLYTEYWTDAMQDAMTLGSSRLIRGPSVSAPNLPHYKCSLLKPGTPVHVEPIMPGMLRITAKAPDGHFIRGVTQGNMVGELPTIQTNNSGPTGATGDHNPSPGTADQTDAGPVVPGKDGVGFPSCIYCPDAAYSQEARAAGVNGTVVLQIVVEPDGHTANIQIVKSLGYGLDELAAQAVRNWRFKAAVGPNGVAVPTTVPVEITFRLK